MHQARGGRLTDRSAWRSAHARHSAAAAVGATAVVFGLRFLTIPLSLRIAGPEGYGLWLTAGSLIAWAGLADMGIGSGLVHSVATACAAEDWPAARRHVSTAVFSFALLSLPLALVAVWVSRHPAILLTLKPALRSQAGAVFAIAGLAFAGSFALNWVGPLCAALQEGYRASIASAAAGVATVVWLYWMRGHGATLTRFALASALPPLAATVLVALGLLTGRHRNAVRPSLVLWNRGSLRAIMGQGTPLFVVQLSDLAILNTANLFIAHFYGLSAVARYSVALALFATVSRICYASSSAYWPAYADAFAREDWDWLRSAARANLALTASAMALAGACFVLIGRPLILWWAGRAALPPTSLLVALAFYFLASTCSTTTGSLLNGLGLAPLRAWLRLFVAAAHLAGGWLLLPHLGLAAIPLAGGLGYLADFLISLAVAHRHVSGAMLAPLCPRIYADESA